MPKKKSWGIAATAIILVAIAFAIGTSSLTYLGLNQSERPEKIVAAPENLNKKGGLAQVTLGGDLPEKTLPPTTTISIAGRDLDIRFRIFRPLTLALKPGQTAASIYPKLVERALNGDAVGGRILAEQMDRCRRLSVNEDDHQRMLEAIEKEKTYYPEGKSADNAVPVDPNDVENFAKYLSSEFEYCQGLTLEQRHEGKKWAEIAAEHGDLLAARLLIDKLEGDPEEQVKWLERSWAEHGDVNAPAGLAALYLDGKIADKDGEFSPNYKLGYAYSLIAAELQFEQLARFSEEYRTAEAAIKSEIAETLSILSANLSPREHLEAEEFAINLLESNKNCCFIE